MPDTNTEVRRLELRGNLRKFFNGMKDPEIILDGPAGTGKTRVLLERQHYILMKYPNARGLMGRKFRSSMSETCMGIMRTEVLQQQADGSCKEGVRWRERDQKWLYPNGSEFVVCGMDEPQKLLSSMYDFIYFNEVLEIPLVVWETASSRLRNFKVPYQQMLGDTNPGPPTHWIKKREKEGKLKLLATFHKDNPVYYDDKKKQWTEKGQTYVNNILSGGLSGITRKRLYEGKWVAAEGQIYDGFNSEIHVIPRRELPRYWPRYWSFDFGFIDPFVWQMWAEDPDTGCLYLEWELYHSRITVAEACAIIRPHVQGYYPPVALICDHDAENRATLEKELGYLTLPAFKSIHPGIGAVQARLKDDKYLGRPKLYLLENANIQKDQDLNSRHQPVCTQDEFDRYVWDTGKMSIDQYKDMPVDKYNHGLDALRYMVAFLDDVPIDPQQRTDVINYADVFDDESEQIDHALATMISLY